MALPNVTATIPSGGSLSAVITMAGKLSGILIPAQWTAAPLSFITSPDFGASWAEFCINGNEFVVPVFSPSSFAGIDWRFWGGVTALQVRSGIIGAPVNQDAARTLILTQQA